MSDEQKALKLQRDFEWQIHGNINQRQDAIRAKNGNHDGWEGWLYESQRVQREIRYLPVLIGRERRGELPKTFKYCSHSPTEQLPVENKLMCCLGQELKACEILRDTFKDAESFPSEMIDEAKAHVCVTHILTESAKRLIDTSEGFVLDETDRQFWQRTYRSMMEEPHVPCCDECETELSEKEMEDSMKVGSVLRCKGCLAKVGLES